MVRHVRPDEIEKRARLLLKQAGVEAAPVPIERVAKQLGIRIERSDLGPDCSGVLVREGGRAVIGVNWDHHSNRQRFTIAHEIAHFQLHDGTTYVDSGYRLHFRDLEAGSGTKREEIEANRFAAALLMPAQWVLEDFRKRPFDLAAEGEDLEEMARRFEVSTQAMAIRLTTVLNVGHDKDDGEES
jgi:Zn-dependent peptidase ImmA (M78 family)